MPALITISFHLVFFVIILQIHHQWILSISVQQMAPKKSFHCWQIFFYLINNTEIYKALRKLKSSKITGTDNLNPHFVHLSAPIISPHLAHIFNLTFLTGIISPWRKSASVTPLLKIVTYQTSVTALYPNTGLSGPVSGRTLADQEHHFELSVE